MRKAKSTARVCASASARSSSKRKTEQDAKFLQSQKMALVGQMAAGVAHEINTPLGTIALLAGELKSAITENRFDTKISAEILTDIEAAVMRISQITNGLRDIARDSSRDPFVFANVKEIIESTLCLCQNKFSNHGVEIKQNEVPDNLEIECHPAQIGQILLNLLSNSYDAIQQMKGKWIQLEVLDQKDKVEISVTDSGAGIPSSIREKIFQPFFTTKDPGAGTGLGLSIVHSLVESHGGQICLDTKSKHTKFIITLPKHQSF